LGGVIVAALIAGWLTPGRGEAAAFPPSERLLPAATRVWVSAADPQALKKRFERSALGGLVYDPLMSTFLDGLRQQGKTSADPLRGTLEITLQEVDQIAGGEICLCAVEQADGRLTTALLIDASGREQQVKAVVEAVCARVAAKGGKPLAAAPTIKAFEVPPAAAAATGGAATGDAAPRQFAVAVMPAAVVVGDRLDAVTALAASVGQSGPGGPGGQGGTSDAAGNGRAGTLATLPSFAKVAERCAVGVPASAPTLRWFVDPLAYLAADRRTYPPKKGRKGPDYVAIFKRQGFDAVNGAGGCLFFGEGKVDLRHNTLIHAPAQNGRPADGPDRFQKAARMLCFPNVGDLAPAAWVPGGAASWTAFEWDIATAFDSMQPLVDDVVGEAGVFEDVIASLQDDPDGPQIDVRGGLIKHLGRRCAIASDHVSPIDADCERTLIAIEARDPAAVAAVVGKGMTSEGNVRTVPVGEHVIWETVKPARAVGAADRPASDDGGDDAAARRRNRQRERKEDDSVWPNLSVAVANGHVLLASHRDVLERALATSQAAPIAEDASYATVAAELKQLLGDQRSLTSFNRTEKLIRPAYELLRAGRLRESRSLAGTMLRRMLEGDGQSGEKSRPAATAGQRQQKVDGSSLPEFEQIRHFFGVTGLGMQSTPDGWYLVGVGLWDGGKQSAGAPQTK
jgi:hypothetical protein